MLFVIDMEYQKVPLDEDVFLLQHQAWNDWWEYENMYFLSYRQRDMSLYPIGNLKIGEIDPQDGENPVPNLPSSFIELDSNRFISLGQDVSYYTQLNALGKTLRESVLRSLQDISFDLDLYHRYADYKVVISSLMRSVGARTVQNQFNRIGHGGAVLTSYHFQFSLPESYSLGSNLSIAFDVKPNSTPPTNIHILIGRNGVGKTHLLKSMIDSLYYRDTNESFGTFTFTGNGNQFANMVCMAFSVFDNFPQSSDTGKIKFTFIGSSLQEGTSLSDSLTNQFATSLTECMEYSSKFQRWQDVIQQLNSDPIFEEIDLVGRITSIQNERIRKKMPRNQVEEQIREIFMMLSSGHKIVALSITRLVETVEECTLALIDEPELHLHPPLLSSFVRALSKLMIDRNGVAIIATHSPVVLQEVPQKCVWTIRRRGREVAIERPSIETFGENVSRLTSDVFQLEVTNSGFFQLLREKVKEADGDFDECIERFQNQLGEEARSMLLALSYQYTGEQS